jgi:hypothetical protein
MRFPAVVAVPLLLATCLAKAEGQAQPYSILRIEFENATLYVRGFCGPADRGKDPTKLPRPTYGPLGSSVGIADIVSVNGQPVKGTAIEGGIGVVISPKFSPGTAIGDFIASPAATTWDLGFLNLDGTVIGTVHIDGHGSGVPPPGAPKEITAAAWTVTGGTGAFFGARGYFQAPQDPVSGERITTDCEDPAYRRINADPGGNKRHPTLYLVPLVRPRVVMAGNSPWVVHADGSLVSTANPAKVGEILTLFASDLGPTKPGVDPGQPFTANPPQLLNSPVEVLVNGSPCDVLYAAGRPGVVDSYQVDFRLPNSTMPGQAVLQLTSAWIAGPEVNIPVQ